MSDAAKQLAAATLALRERRIAEAEALYRRILGEDPDNAEALRGLGAIDFQLGRYEAAELMTRRLLTLRPGDPAVHLGLGTVLQRRGRLDEASEAYKSALVINPSHLRSVLALGELHRLQDRFEEAEAAARRALIVDPSSGDACNLLGAALQGRGETQEAIRWFEQAAVNRPDDARVHYNLGVAFQALKRDDDARSAYQRALQLDPKLMEAHNNLGTMFVTAGRAADAIDHLRTAVDLAPGSATAHNNLGQALYKAGYVAEALSCFEHALRIDPNYAEALANIGAALRSMGQPDAALVHLDRALALQPDFAVAHGNRCMVLRDLGRLDEAADGVLRALAIRPDEAEFHVTLALVHNDRGLHGPALASCRRAMALKPTSAGLHQRFLGLMPYSPALTAAERFAECRAFGVRFGRHDRTDIGFRDRDPHRRLRVGYVSSDLRRGHPVARNLRPLFTNRDRSRFEAIVYADVPKLDETSAEFKSLADDWRSIEGQSDAELASIIRRDEIDILVILAGRFDRNRPLVASYRPAPVQFSFHDAATSGVDGTDYLVSDRIMAPANGAERFTERVLRLPHFYVHDPLAGAPVVRPLPLGMHGVPTFGCFNNPAKMSDECLALWARLLNEIRDARLVLKFRSWYQSGVLRERVIGALVGAGVAADRLRIIESDEAGKHHLDIYNEVDVALDPFPFNGSTSTFESLWMGVPVVTFVGDTMVSRWTASMLDVLGLRRLAAPTPDDYIRAAAELVADATSLAALRAGLRARVAASALCDGRSRTRQIERLYRAAWRRFCAGAR